MPLEAPVTTIASGRPSEAMAGSPLLSLLMHPSACRETALKRRSLVRGPTSYWLTAAARCPRRVAMVRRHTVWRDATRENLLLSELQFPQGTRHRAAPDQVSRDHERVAAPWMRIGGLENPKPRHDAEIAHGPDQKPVCRSRQNAASRSEQGVHRASRGAIAEVSGERGSLPPALLGPTSGHPRKHPFDDFPRRQGIALRRRQSSMHGSRGSGHCEGAGDASEGAYEQAVRNHLHLTSRATPPVTWVPEGVLGSARQRPTIARNYGSGPPVGKA